MPLVLPAYSNTKQISYATFVRDLQQKNVKGKDITEAEANKALSRVFVSLWGGKISRM